MKKHQFFDLQILGDDEVSNLLGHQVTSRETLAQWPLSCVEKITCNANSTWIVKANHKPCDIEGHFYQQVDSPYIVKPVYIHSSSPYQTIIYQYIEGAPYSSVNLNKKRDTEICFREDFQPMLASVSNENLPVYLKTATEQDFLLTFGKMLNRLTKLVSGGKFPSITIEELETLSEIIQSNTALELALTDTGLVHGDFSVDNILYDTTTDKLIFLDWQRPIYGSPIIDEYAFVKSKGFKPNPPAMLMGSMVQINWLTDCAMNWFPPGIDTYDRQIKGLLDDLFNAFQEININQIKI